MLFFALLTLFLILVLFGVCFSYVFFFFFNSRGFLSQCASALLAVMSGSNHKSDVQVNFVARYYARAIDQTEKGGTM